MTSKNLNSLEKKTVVSSSVKLIEIISETPTKIILNGILFFIKKLKITEIEKPDEVFERIDKFERFEKSMELSYYLNSTGLFP